MLFVTTLKYPVGCNSKHRKNYIESVRKLNNHLSEAQNGTSVEKIATHRQHSEHRHAIENETLEFALR